MEDIFKTDRLVSKNAQLLASRGDTHLAIEPWTSAPSGLSNEPVLGEIAQIEAGGVKRTTVKLKSSNDQKKVIAATNLDQE